MFKPTICTETEHSCQEKKCSEQQNECPQIDSCQIIYKLRSKELSEYNYLGIGKGENLEKIIEVLIKLILDSNPNFVETFNYEQKTLKEVLDYFYLHLNSLTQTLILKEATINTLNIRLTALEEKVEGMYHPQITDTNGTGFTTNSTLKTVIQTLANNI